MAARRIDHQDVPPDEHRGRWLKAREHLRQMDKALEDGAHNSAAALAILAVIAANDAFTIRHLGKQCASERHEDAAELFAQVWLNAPSEEARRHLDRVIRCKRWIDYSNRYPKPEETQSICRHARRFVEFVGGNLD